MKEIYPVDYQYLEPLLAKISYMSDFDIEQVRRAYAIAYEGHDGQTRSSGQPYITHPVAVAGILADMQLDVESIQSAILHDTIEDTKFTKDDLINLFGEVVANIVDGVSKLDKLKFRTRQEAEVANFRKMILAMTKDIRVVLIKLADRTHNMRTIDALRPDKQRRIAQETVDIYSSLAYRLGIMHIKRELDFLSFKAIYPLRYKLLYKARQKAVEKNQNHLDKVLNAIREQLLKLKINATVTIEERSLLNLYRKMLRNHQKFSSILDAFRFVIKTQSVDDCYRALGVVHSLFRPVPEQFQDYIALPKSNGYQSLVTGTINSDGEPVEVFIRTEAMDEIAEKGIASTLVYNKEDKKNIIGGERIQQWLTSLSELQHMSVNSIEFNTQIKKEICPDDIFVFTPRGKIIELPHGSTVLDFAFYIHSEVGVHCSSALVDGIEAELNQVLRSGQTVTIFTNESSFPTERSLSDVRSSRAKARIREALKEREMQKYEYMGRRILETLYGKDVDNINQTVLAKALDFFNLKSLNDLFAEICFGNIISPVVKAVIDSYTDQNLLKESSVNVLLELQNGTLYSDLTYKFLEDNDYNIEIDETSFVTPYDEIMITSNFGKGLLVHSIDSPVIQQKNLTPYQHIRIRWGVDSVKQSKVRLKLHFAKTKALEKMINALITNLNNYHTNVLRSVVSSAETSRDYIVVVDLQLSSTPEIQKIVDYLRNQDDLSLITVTRVMYSPIK